MRILAAAAVAVLLTAAIVLAIGMRFLNRMIISQRTAILQRAEQTLGRKIAVDNIAGTLWSGLGIRFEHAHVADDPRFSDADFASAMAVTARPRLWPLLHGRFEISRVDVTQPEIRLLRDENGQWNCATLGQTNAPAAASPAPPAGDAPPAAHPALPSYLARAQITDGTVIIIDRTHTPPYTTRLTGVALSLNDISDLAPIRVTLDAALDADVANVHIDGRVGPLRERDAIPFEFDAKLGPLGPQNVVIDALHVTAVVTPDAVQASQLSGRAFGGTFALAARYPLRADGPITLKGDLSEVDIAKALQLGLVDAAQRITGAAHLDVDLQAIGNSGDAIEATLAGIVAADVQRGALKDFNLVNEVLGHATGLPAIGKLLSDRIRPKYARLFADDTTRFETFRGTFHIAERRVRTEDLVVIATDYGVRAGGSLSFDRDVDLRGTLIMSKHFSDDLAADITAAKYAMDQRGELALPFRMRGRLGHAKPAPDLESLAGTLRQALTHGAAKDFLGRLLGGKHKQPTPGVNEPRDLLERGLHDLLGQ